MAVFDAAPNRVTFTDISAGFSPKQGAILYATSQSGIYLSRDGGATWLPSPLPGKGAQVRAIATSLLHPESAYVSYSHLQLDGKTWMGVARTRDAGHTWSLVWKEDKTSSPNIHDNWISKQIGVEWGENPLELGVAEQDPELCYGTDFGRTMITTDGGATWRWRLLQTSGGRQLDEHRPGRHNELWLSFRSIRQEPPLHSDNGHRSLPQRRQRPLVDALGHRRSRGVEQYDLLGRLRSSDSQQDVGRDERNA